MIYTFKIRFVTNWFTVNKLTVLRRCLRLEASESEHLQNFTPVLIVLRWESLSALSTWQKKQFLVVSVSLCKEIQTNA